MTMYGLNQPYKINRPLTKRERNLQLHQNRRRKVKCFNIHYSAIRLNSTCLETVDKFYKNKGVDNGVPFLMLMAMTIFIIYIMYEIGADFIEKGVSGFLLTMFFMLLIPILPAFFCAYLLFKEWFKWTHFPVRFNRKNGMVYVFRPNGTILSAPWETIFFTQDKDPGPLRDWCIRGHILGQDDDTVIETFSLGVCDDKNSLSEYWEFIRCYMEEMDTIPFLARLIVFCPPVEVQKEGFVFGLQSLINMQSRIEWLFLPLKLPLIIVGMINRYIASQTSKIPRWPQDIEDACRMEPGDPVNVSAADNPKDMWRLVLANQTYTDWQKLYARREAATKKIIEILDARYNDAG